MLNSGSAAHAVRHHSTKQFRTVYSLHAERRWCVTGTPIQNRLEDLGSLIRFLRVAPFDSEATFRKYISEPLLTDLEAGDRNLRLLLRMICLRRTRVLLDIPNSEDQTIVLSLSSEERSLYSHIIDDTARKIDDCISSRSVAKAYSGIFGAILRLRLLCNNGTQQTIDSISEVEVCRSEGQVAEDVIAACPICASEINVSDGRDEISPGASPQSSRQLLCPTCLSFSEVDDIERNEELKKQRYAKYRLVQTIDTIGNSSSRPHNMDSESSASLRQNPLSNGKSTKMAALLSNIQEHMSSNKRYLCLPLRPNKNHY